MSEDEINRLYLLALEMNPGLAENGREGYDEIEGVFKALRLGIICSEEISVSVPYQAALLTAINSGKRCFMGGIMVKLPEEAKCLLPYWKGKLLKDVVVELGGQIVSTPDIEGYLLTIGSKPTTTKSFQLVCSDWVGGVAVKGDDINLVGVSHFPIGGILAASIGVGLCFIHAMGISKSVFNSSTGISLWRPDLIEEWNSFEAAGPMIKNFPDKLWLLGLGHLGQAYAWSIGLMNFIDPNGLEVLLHDFDSIVKANFSAGLLAEQFNIGQKKTRTLANWLELRGISTRIVESKYSAATNRCEDDPEIMLGGLDSLQTRKILHSEQFKLLIDCGIGGTVGTFDMIRINTFPFAGKTPQELWANAEQKLEMPGTKRLTEKINGCGFVKGIATSFVGAFASCLVLSEILRAYHKGLKIAYQNMSLRDFENRRVKVIGSYGLNELQTRFTSF
jgi:hypothetical protein